MPVTFEHEPIYSTARTSLYTQEELRRDAFDDRVYARFVEEGALRPHPDEALSRRLHDYTIDMALDVYLKAQVDAGRKLVGIMGGSSTRRDDPAYRRTAETAMLLAQSNFLVISGGGTGMMEAANLGAYLVPHGPEALDAAIGELARCPTYGSADYRARALDVLERYPAGGESLGVPTWFYGHEPTNYFAAAVAKYFSNSLREDGLLGMAVDGVVYTPGSAGTTQEIFQDAAQNHYGTYEFRSPMVFLGVHRFAAETHIYPTLYGLATAEYRPLLAITDDPDEVVRFLLRAGKVPVRKPAARPVTL